MTCITDTKSKRQVSTKHAAVLALSAVLVLGTLVASASAQDRRDDHRGDRGRGGWGGIYVAPPIVYGSPYYAPYYAPPPVVYGPGIGIALPGVNVNIR